MIYLVLCIVLTLTTQVLLKHASLKNSKLKTGSYLKGMITTPKVLVAYVLSGINVFIWIIALSKTSLLTAFFITSFTYVIMVFVDHFVFKENLNFIKLIGAFFITAGVIFSMI